MRRFLNDNLGWKAESLLVDAKIHYRSPSSREVGFFLNDTSTDTINIQKRRPDLGIRSSALTYFPRIFDERHKRMVTAKTSVTVPFVSAKEFLRDCFQTGEKLSSKVIPVASSSLWTMSVCA